MTTAWLVVTPGLKALSVQIYYDDMPPWWPKRNKLYGYGKARAQQLTEAECQLPLEALRTLAEQKYPTMAWDIGPCKCDQREELLEPFPSYVDPTMLVVAFEPACRTHGKPLKVIREARP